MQGEARVMNSRLVSAALAVRHRLQDERGDIPGWVLVTLMTALLVAAIWGVAQGQLVNLFNRAMGQI
jgi:hypothetical protein